MVVFIWRGVFEGVVVMLPRPRLRLVEAPEPVDMPGREAAVPGVMVPV